MHRKIASNIHMPAFITWRLWLRKIYHQKGTELWINRSIAQKVCLIAFIGQKLKTIRSKLRQISAQDSLRALPEMRWICALTIHFIATDLRQFFEVKSCRPLYRYIKRLWLSFGGEYINLHGKLQHWVPKFQKSRKSALRRLFSLSQRVKFGKWLRHEL